MRPEQLRESHELLRASSTARPVGVDRKANVLRGYVVAQLGAFKSQGRGEFDLHSLEEIVRLGNASKQLKSRFNHETMCDSALGRFLGRPRDFFMSEAKNADGQTVPAVRADLYFDQTALDTPPDGGKALGLYVMDLAESDPDALSSSLVLRVNKEYRLKTDGTKQTGPDGEELPPLWRPTHLRGSDIVDTGDAVDGLLSVGTGLPDEIARKGAAFLDENFQGASRKELADKLRGYVDGYLTYRFGEEELFELPVPTLTPIVVPEPVPVTPPEPAQPAQPSLSFLLMKQRQRELDLLT